MKYLTKIELGGSTYYGDVSETQPYISDVSLILSSGMGALAIGGIASDTIKFTLHNSESAFVDGDKIIFYVAPADVEEITEIELIAEETTEASQELEINTDDEGDDSDGEEVTEAEIAEAEALSVKRIQEGWEFFVPEEEETTEAGVDEPVDEIGHVEGVGDEAEPLWIRKGTFYVTEAKTMNSGKTISIVAMDALALLNDQFVPINETATVLNMYNDLKTQIEAKLDDLSVEPCDYPYEFDITLPSGNVSYRQAYGYFAGLFGGYAQVSDDNVLQIDYYGALEEPIIGAQVTAFNETSSGAIIVESLTCDNECSTLPSGTQLIQSGTGEGLTFSNPWMNQACLDDALAKVIGLQFRGAIVTAMWNPNLVAGSAVRVMTDEEWAQWNVGLNQLALGTMAEADALTLKGSLLDLGRVIMTNYQTITFGDHATTRIRSELRTTTDRENEMADSNAAIAAGISGATETAIVGAQNYVDAQGFATETYVDNQDGALNSTVFATPMCKDTDGTPTYKQFDDDGNPLPPLYVDNLTGETTESATDENGNENPRKFTDALSQDIDQIEDKVEANYTALDDLIKDTSSALSQEIEENSLIGRGYATVDGDKVTLGKEGAEWSTEVDGSGIHLKGGATTTAELVQDGQTSTLKVSNSKLSNIKFRSVIDTGELGIVAQSNGHVSLKGV